MPRANVDADATGASRNSLSARSGYDKNIRAAIKEGRKKAKEEANAVERWYWELQKGWC